MATYRTMHDQNLQGGYSGDFTRNHEQARISDRLKADNTRTWQPDFRKVGKMKPENQQRGRIPERLKELLVLTAKEYQWSSEKLAYIEKGLRNQNWSAEQLALIEQTIRDENWTTKHIAELEKSFREHNTNGDFIVLTRGRSTPVLAQYSSVHGARNSSFLGFVNPAEIEIEIKVRCKK